MPERKKSWPAVLGDTVEEIAESLRKQGARGIPKDCKNCIIARSYKLFYPRGWGGLHASRTTYKGFDGKLTHSCRLSFDDCPIMDPIGSAALAEFMCRFDEGEFPDLITGAIPTAEDVLSRLSIEDRIAIGK